MGSRDTLRLIDSMQNRYWRSTRGLVLPATLGGLALLACSSPALRDAEGPPRWLRPCGASADCLAGESCAPLTADRRACAPSDLAGLSSAPGPQGQNPFPALLWAGPYRARPRDRAGELLGGRTLAATVSGPLSVVWEVGTAGRVEGLVICDLDDDDRAEIAVLVRRTDAPGQVIVYNRDGSVRWSHTAATDLAGAITAADVDGDQRDEIAYCELDTAGMCRVLDETGAPIHSFGPFYVPGYAGGGPAAADVNGDGAEDLFVATYGGMVVAVDGRSRAELWRYDAWAAGVPPYREQFHGHPAVDDIDGDGTDELVVGGANFGGVFVLDARTGAEEWVLRDRWASSGGYFLGNGAALVDVDNNSDTLEILVAMVGEPDAVVAYRADGVELWRVPFPGADFSWITPVATDVDNNDDYELIVQTREGGISVLEANGSVRAASALGSEIWASPSVINADGDPTATSSRPAARP